jgi:hypothetical protein
MVGSACGARGRERSEQKGAAALRWCSPFVPVQRRWGTGWWVVLHGRKRGGVGYGEGGHTERGAGPDGRHRPKAKGGGQRVMGA